MRIEFIPYLLVAVPLLPLIAAVLNGLVFATAERGKRPNIQYWAIFFSVAALLLAGGAHFCLLSLHPPLIGEASATIISPYKWMSLAYPLRLDWSIRFDALTTIMVPVVLFVGLMVQIFSVGYLADRKQDYARYFAWLSFFMFSMLLLVTAANLFVFFVGWEAVGLSSYKLISFYVEKDAAQRAGKKAFIINRIGDAALLIAMFAIFRVAGTADFREIAVAFSKSSIAASHANFIGLMIFIAATAKSAQIPLYTWLPDAMTGPTPVSALIHAATMVTAGIFLMLRLEPIFVVAPEASLIVAWTGGLTALLAAFIAVAQTDIKKVLAFSTVSQLGLMVLAVGTGSYTAAFFHLFTHAFFKAMLFLSAGAVITYKHHEQNIRHMGGMIKERPFLAVLFWLALAALAGLPGLSGFFSKDHILAAAFALKAGGNILGGIAVAASLLTAFYSFRLGIIIFHGKKAAAAEHTNHGHSAEPSVTFYLPLVLLAVPAIAAGWLGLPAFFTGYESRFFDFIGHNFPIPVANFTALMQRHLEHTDEMKLVTLSVAVACAGAIAAIIHYGILGRRPAAEGAYHKVFTRLSLNKLYVDEIYQFLFVTPYKKIAEKISDWDFRVIPAISDGIGYLTESIGTALAGLQNGVLGHYAAYMFGGILILLLVLGTL
jgi:NADH-quinone oxidoreductase subunit L